MNTHKPFKGVVRHKPACRPVVGQCLLGEHESGQAIRTSPIVAVRQTANGREVETRHSRYLAVEEPAHA